MRDPNRIPIILEKLNKIWSKYPDMRLNQLMFSINYLSDYGGGDYWHLEDDEFDKCLDKWIKAHE